MGQLFVPWMRLRTVLATLVLFCLVDTSESVDQQQQLPAGIVGREYSLFLPAKGGKPPYAFSFTDTLPPDLKLNVSTGELSGTPKLAGEYSFSVQVVDDRKTKVERQVSLKIIYGDSTHLTIITSALPKVIEGESYLLNLAAVGGTPPYQWEWVTEQPLSGLNLGADGVIRGKPDDAGIWTVDVTVHDAQGGEDKREFVLEVIEARWFPWWLEFVIMVLMFIGALKSWASLPSRCDWIWMSHVPWPIDEKTGKHLPNDKITYEYVQRELQRIKKHCLIGRCPPGAYPEGIKETLRLEAGKWYITGYEKMTEEEHNLYQSKRFWNDKVRPAILGTGICLAVGFYFVFDLSREFLWPVIAKFVYPLIASNMP